MRNLWMALTIAMCFGVTSTAIASHCLVTDSGTSNLSGRLALEFPSGPIDGNNQAFGLSGTPLEGTEVTIYSDGGVLVSIASSLVGKDNTFSLTSPPRPGVVLLASYCKASYTHANAGVPTSGTIISIARQALLESVVQKSTANQQSMLTNLSGHSQEASAVVTTAARRHNAAFMSLLSHMLQPHDGVLFSGASIQAAETGLEGTGDKPLALPYATQARDDSNSLLVRTEKSSPNLGPNVSPLPRSLRLLQRRLIEMNDEDQELTSRRKK